MDAARFEQLWKSSASFRKVSPELEPLVRAVYTSVVENDARATHAGLERLLEHLASPRGRTDANCCVVDAFFSASDRWERNWDTFPSPLRDVLGDVGGVLHDTIYAPHIARNFQSLPEQVLERLNGDPES